MVKKSLKWTILAYASEPDKEYKYEGDIVEYDGKRYFVSLAEERVEFVGVVKEESPSLELSEVGESAIEGIATGLSIEDILERADVVWFDDLLNLTRTVVSRSDKPLIEYEKAMLKRMWENQGVRLHIEFKED